MSDSFADLWNSTGVSKPAEQPRKLGSLTPVVPPARNAKNDVFSMLASPALGSSPASRSGTPGATGPIQSTQSLGTGGMSPFMGAKPVQKSTSSGGDAFSGLFPGSLASGSTANRANMTIAERAAQAERERREQMQQQHAAAKQSANAWTGLDSLGEFTTAKPSTPAQATAAQDDDWIFGSEPPKPSASATKASTSKSPPPPSDDWGLDDFIAQPAAPKPASAQPRGHSLLDLDEFSPIPTTQSSRASPRPAHVRSSTPGDFDFGDREDGLLDNQSDDDDILGELSKPVSQRPPPFKQPSRATPSPQSAPSHSGRQSRAVSPPPHILGKIVEMGFSVEQARVALASTDTGLDVEAALETLLANAGVAEPTPRESARAHRSEREPGYERYYESDEEQAAPSRRRPALASRPSASGRAREAPSRNGASPTSDGQKNLQEQADKLLAQASEIGLSVFNRANAFWKEGKEKAMKAYEERAASAASRPTGTSSPSRNGRPKWMQEAPEEFRDGEWRDGPGGFVDDDEVLPQKPAPQGRPKQAEGRPRPSEPEPKTATSRVKTGSLLSDDAPAVYTSPWRRKTPSRSHAPTPPSQPAASTSRAQPPPRAPSPIQLTQRKTVSASPAAIAASAKHKATGTEMFKLGRYAEAETSYTSAIAALPDAHLLLVPLYNNRALARIKTGDHNGAIEDATTVITLVGPSYHPAREAKVAREDEGAGIDLADALVKAFWRRAEAYEGKERWEAARKDWETIAGADFAGKARMEAVKGVGRCRKVLSAGVDGAAAASGSTPARSVRSTPKPQTRPRPAPAVVVPTEAVDRVREANQAAEAEAQARHELKDVVDAKLAAWKNGKEANIRALIASLETVLWPELGWQKVGMHELVTPSQVKIRYTKAIAKLHPDKLSAKNLTLEQRMIANGVFGSLNDAWNAFKQ